MSPEERACKVLCLLDDGKDVPHLVKRDIIADAIRAAVADTQAKLDAAKDALRSLYDYQNGPPILKQTWLKGWNDAMAAAEDVLEIPPERREGAIRPRGEKPS